jgi:hypothetical protein
VLVSMTHLGPLILLFLTSAPCFTRHQNRVFTPLITTQQASLGFNHRTGGREEARGHQDLRQKQEGARIWGRSRRAVMVDRCRVTMTNLDPLNFTIVAIVLWIWSPLSRLIEIWWLRSNKCYSAVNLLQYSEQYFLKLLQYAAFGWISVTRSRTDALDCLLQCPLCSCEGNYRGPGSDYD